MGRNAYVLRLQVVKAATDILKADIVFGEDFCRQPLLFPQQAQKQVGGVNVAVVHRPRFVSGANQNLLGGSR
jgi:hypothetical protein